MVINLSSNQPQGTKRGSTASRPAYPVDGELYYNTDKQSFEQYTLAGWFNIAQAPLAPTSITATDQGTGRSFNNGQASVAFTPNSNGGAPSSFIITPSPTTSPATFTVTSSPTTISGLTSSTQYTYTATAVGSYGTSSASSPSTGVTATTVPQAPSLVAVSSSDTTASIAITAGATGGSAITGYTITSNPVTTTQTASSSPYVFTGLTTGTAYTFTAYATSALGNSVLSSASNSITPVVIPVGSFESIASTRFTSNTAGVTFSSIPQNFSHLQIRWVGATVGGDYMYFTTNLGQSSNILGGRFSNYGNSWYTNQGVQSDATYGTELHFGGIDNNYPAAGVIDIMDYSSTTKAKIGLSRLTRSYSDPQYSVNNIVNFNCGLTSTNAITSVTLQAKAAYPLCTGTTVSLYGIKG